MSYFWLAINLSVFLISGLLGINLIRNKIKATFPKINDLILDILLISIFIIASVSTTVQSYRYDTKYKELSNQSKIAKDKLDTILEYGEVAHWDIYGRHVRSDGTIDGSSPIAGWWGKYVKENKGKIDIMCNDEAINHYKKVINKQPNYPYPYYFAAVCFKSNNDMNWGTFADDAIAILKRTTIVPDHAPSQDELLRKIRKLKGIKSEETH